MNETQTPFFMDTKPTKTEDEQPKSLVQYKKKIYSVGFLLIPFCASMFFAWKAVGGSIQGESTGWMFPTLLFSAGISILLLIGFIVSNLTTFFLLALVSSAFSLLVFHGSSSVAYIVVSTLFIWYGLIKIQKDLPRNIHIDIWKSIRQGSTYVILGFSILISCTYYFSIVNMSAMDLMKQFEIRKSSEKMVNQAMGMLNPDFKEINDTEVTVDEFLEALQKSQMAAQNSSETKTESLSDEDLLKIAGIDPKSQRAPLVLAEIKKQMSKEQAADTAEAQKNILLIQSRKQFSTIIGQPLTGQELIADVFSNLIEKSIWSHAQPKTDENTSSSTLAFVLSILLFISLISIGSLLKILWILAVKFLFSILMRFNLVKIKKIAIEQEVIE